MTVITWGGNVHEATNPIFHDFEVENNVKITCDEHAGGSAAVVPKIRAAWPNVIYDAVAAWTPVNYPMWNEGWLVPLTEEELPNMKDIPRGFRDEFPKDSGVFYSSGFESLQECWYYRADLLPKDLQNFKSLEALFDPRLKGKLCIPDMSLNVGGVVIQMAFKNGGDEFHLDPGWEFMKDLAKTGNIGFVAAADPDRANRLSTGDSWLAWCDSVSPGGLVMKGLPIGACNHVEDSKVTLMWDSWVVLKGPKQALAKKWVNYMSSADNETRYAAKAGVLPCNSKSKPPEATAQLYLKPEEFEKYVWYRDFVYDQQHLNEWTTKFETEVLPIIRANM